MVNPQEINNQIECAWYKTLVLMQDLIKSFPHYTNEEGLTLAADKIIDYLNSDRMEIYDNVYKNLEFEDHSLYVKVEEFGDIFSNDRNKKKRNIIAVVDSGKPGHTVILNGHYDVDGIINQESWSGFESWRSGVIDNNILIGRGATDMLAGLCILALITNIFSLYKDSWIGKIIFTAVCDEEIGGNGTLHTLNWLDKNNFINEKTYALIAEPTNKKVCNESLGFFHLMITFTGKSNHMGVAHKYDNAFYKLIDFTSKFDEIIAGILSKMSATSDIEKLRYNWGVLKGGDDAAIPFDRITLEGVIFIPESINSDIFKKTFIKEVANSFSDIIIKFSSFGFEGAHSKDSVVFDQLITLTQKNNLSNLFPSPCDARLFKQFGIPVTVYGPGDLEQAHSINEFIDLSNVRSYVDILFRALWNVMKND